MPRKQNFKVTSFINENAAITRTPANSQNSILTNSTNYGSASPETCKDVESLLSRKEEEKPRATCAWSCAVLCGLASLTFILCFAYLPTLQKLAPHDPRKVKVTTEASANTLRTGQLQVYPNISVVENEDVAKLPYASQTYNINITDKDAAKEIVNHLDNVLKSYPQLSNGNLPDSYVRCYLENPTPDRPCYFNPSWLGETCTLETRFGYTNEEVINPCFLLRLEKTFGWKPILFSPEEVGGWKAIYDPAFVAVQCKQQLFDNGHVDGIRVYPQKGFAIQFFPVSKFDKEKYLLPMVMVQIQGLMRHDAVTIDCQLRAKNAMDLIDLGRVVIHITYDTQPSDSTTENPTTIPTPEAE